MSVKNEVLKSNIPLYDSAYIVDKTIGSGADGIVYIVHLKDNPSAKFAAKVFFKPDDMTDVYWQKHGDEALTSFRISQKNNPNLAKTHEVFVTNDNQIVFIMDYIDGITLRDYLNKHGCLTPKIALNIFKKILNGIKQLHGFKQKIIHRDLKPENIMISHDLSKVIIVDFGISSVVTKDMDKDKVMTNEIDLYGTASYILPDLLEVYKKKDGPRNISVQSDFFSLGIILYEMIMGTLPFNQVKDSDGTLDKRATIKLPLRYDMINISANPTIPPTLENIIYRCITSKPQEIKHRYTDVEQIINDVNNCLPLLDKKSDPTPLLKPVNQRFYQSVPLMDVDQIRQNQKWYKQWWFFGVVFGLAIVLIIVAIIFFFVI